MFCILYVETFFEKEDMRYNKTSFKSIYIRIQGERERERMGLFANKEK